MDRHRSWYRASLLGVNALGLAGSLLLVLESGAAAAARALPALHVLSPRSILSASTCAGNTCQFIDGTGMTVTEWYSQTTAPSAVCTHANFYASGALVAQSASICLSAGGSTSASWDPGSFPAGTNVCSEWTGVPGRPCDRIEG